MVKISVSPGLGRESQFGSTYFEMRMEGGFTLLGGKDKPSLSLNLQYNHRRYHDITTHSLGLGVSLIAEPFSVGPFIRSGVARNGNVAGDFVELGLNLDFGFKLESLYLDVLGISLSKVVSTTNEALISEGTSFVGIGSSAPVMLLGIIVFRIPITGS